MQIRFNREWMKYFHRNKKERLIQLPMFLQRLSVLLTEGYSFAESVVMLLPHHLEDFTQISNIQREIQERLRNGEGVLGVMTTLGLPEQYLISITIAEQNGHLQEALAGIAKQLRFAAGIKSQLKKIMLYPIALLLFLIVLFVMFRTYFFPNIERMYESRGSVEQVGSLQFSKMLLYIPDYGVMMVMFVAVLLLSARWLLYKQTIAKQIQIQLKIPIWSGYFRLMLTSHFAKYLGSLLLSGFSLQASLEILQKQSYQNYLQYCTEQLMAYIVQGNSLAKAIEYLQLFQHDLLVFVEHGENSGFLGKELMIYSELLDERFEEKLQHKMSTIQPLIFVIIAICIVAAYLSMLLPIYSMIEIV